MSGLVKFFREGMTGAPAGGSSVQGNLVAILDACLVNGFNSHTVSGPITVSGTTATVTDSAHGFVDQQVVVFSGASISLFNAEFRISYISSGSYSFQVPSGTGNPTGTITAKTAPLGWTIAFTNTNQRVYRNTGGSGRYLSIDDSAATGAMCVPVWGFETCSGIGAGTDQIPPVANLSGDNIHRWARPYAALSGTSQIGWSVIGDEKRFYAGVSNPNAADIRQWMGYGDFVTYSPTDTYNTFIMGDPSQGSGAGYQYYLVPPTINQRPTRSGSGSFFATDTCYQRAYDGTTVGVSAGLSHGFAISASNIGMSSTSYSNIGAGATDQLSPVTGAMELLPVDFTETSAGSSYVAWRRGRLPGILAYLGNAFRNTTALQIGIDGTVDTGVPTYGSVIRLAGAGSSPGGGLIFALGIPWDNM